MKLVVSYLAKSDICGHKTVFYRFLSKTVSYNSNQLHLWHLRRMSIHWAAEKNTQFITSPPYETQAKKYLHHIRYAGNFFLRSLRILSSEFP